MNIVGKTEDGKLVVSGIFMIYDALGLPLEDIIFQLNKRNMVIDWISFYDDAIERGWKVQTIFTKLVVLEDLYDKDYKLKVIGRLIAYSNMKEKENGTKT